MIKFDILAKCTKLIISPLKYWQIYAGFSVYKLFNGQVNLNRVNLVQLWFSIKKGKKIVDMVDTPAILILKILYTISYEKKYILVLVQLYTTYDTPEPLFVSSSLV